MSSDYEAELAQVTLERDMLLRRIAEYEASRSSRLTRWLYRWLRRLRSFAERMRPIVIRAEDSLPHRLRRSAASNDDQEGLQPTCLAPSDEPLVSFIIPVYGELDLSMRCLSSIGASASAVSYEVIVIDDASPEDSCAALREIPGVRLLQNETNQGYLRSVNRAASVARGRYLFLLNNDTIVTDSCADELVRTMERDPSVGAVGAKLVFPDGRLQEVGSFVWSDGSGHNVGHGRAAGSSDHAFVREVDYCSAAALLVRFDAWQTIGGFDERFVPAYYEDTDLAFALRALGLRSIVQPSAVVHHVAGASHGSGEDSLSAKYQERNRERFVAKWPLELASRYDSRFVPYALSLPHESHVMVIDELVPVRERDSGALRMWRLLELLNRPNRRVTLTTTSRHPTEPAASVLRDLGIDVEDGLRSVRKAIEVRADELDAIIVSRPHVAAKAIPQIRSVAPGLPVIYDMVDFHQLRHERRVEIEGSVLSRRQRRLARFEREAICEADHVIAITEREASFVRSLRGDDAVSVVGNVHSIQPSGPEHSERTGLLFVGSWAHPPNRDAVSWLLEDVMPAIWGQAPSAKLHLAGSGMPTDLAVGDERVVNHGWVNDLGSLFDEALVAIAPLRFGAGMKGKVGDALSRGVPVLATAVAAEGFPLEAVGFGSLETPDEFANAFARLANDPSVWTEIRSQGLEMIEKHLTAAHASAELELIFRGLGVVA